MEANKSGTGLVPFRYDILLLHASKLRKGLVPGLR